MSIELVIFDCDGVLVDSEPLCNEVFARHLSALGLNYSTQRTMEQFMGKSMKTCMAEVSAQLQSAQLPLPAGFPERFLDELQRETFDVLATQVQPVEGIRSAIESISKRGVKICVASSGDHEKMRVTLGKTDLANLFQGHIFSATQVAHGKPAPDLFLFAAKQMQVLPAHCLVVEDSPYGLQAAVSANMRAVGYSRLTGAQRLTAQAEVKAAVAAHQIVLIDQMDNLTRHVFI